MKKMKKIKNTVRDIILLLCLCSLSILSASANLINPDNDWPSSPIDMNDSPIFKNENTDNTESFKPFGGEDSPVLRAQPGGSGGGNGQKEVPIDNGIQIVIYMTLVYFLICRIIRRKKIKNIFIIICALLSSFGIANAQIEADYTVPSWTLYRKSVVAGAPNTGVLVSKNYPYNVNVTVNGAPSSQFGATWFTNAGVTGTKLQLKEGITNDFTGAREINATSTAVNNLIYVSTSAGSDDLVAKTGFSKGATRSYVSNKVLMDKLQPNTTYSYRVGGVNGAWSETGTFTTAKTNKDAFEFILITDTQANTDDMFEVSRKTVACAQQKAPNAKFVLMAGDHVDTVDPNSEWEWEQWFEIMKASWQKLPIAPIQGNHDRSAQSNLFHHFNTDKSFNASVSSGAQTAMEGTVYSFVYGDALFMCINYEDYAKGETYFAALEAWMRAQIAANPYVKWKIVAVHKDMFTGSASHQGDADGKTVRERMAPVFQDMDIDLVIQGHDHIYEVIGVLVAGKSGSTNTYTHLPDAVGGQTKVTGGTREDMTGIHGGKFNVSGGVLYFLNNSAGKKKYEPSTQTQMDAAFSATQVPNYYQMFNRFGQTGEPTFSQVKVSTDAITIATYTISDSGVATLYDEFSVVKFRTISEAGFRSLICQ